MRIYIFIVLAFSCYSIDVHCSPKLPTSFYSIEKRVSRYPRKKISNFLRSFISESRPNRIVGGSGHDKSIKWIINNIKKVDKSNNSKLEILTFKPDIDYALRVYENDFKNKIANNFSKDDVLYKKWRKFTDLMLLQIKSFKGTLGKNIVWEKKGIINPEQVIILGAHFDTIAHDKETKELRVKSIMPGADDNATAVALLLSFIEFISKYDLPKTVRVVFFDFEEIGFLGSRAYVQEHLKELKKDKVVGFVNLEMLGYDTKLSDSEKRYGNMKMYITKKGSKTFKKDHIFAKRYQFLGKNITSAVQFKIDPNGFDRSDNINFTDEAIPTLTLSQNWESDFNVNYHTENDLPESLNFKTIYNSFKFIAGATIGWSLDLIK